MFRKPPANLIYLLGLLILLQNLPAQTPTLSEVEGLTRQWIALRSTLAEEARQWQQRKAAWQEEIALLEQQAQKLEEACAASREEMTSADARQADVQNRRDHAGQELQNVDRVLEQAGRRARQSYDRIPPSLQQTLPEECHQLFTTPDRMTRTERAQALVTILSSLEAMQLEWHTGREILQTTEGTRQVDTLYLGLAQAFAVSPDNDWAAVGRPGSDGWSWQEGEVDAASVRRLIGIQQELEPATLISLPLQVEATP
jgi:hypothetical protein